MDTRVKKIREAAAFIKENIGGKTPEVGIILGSGLGKLGDAIEAEAVIPYAKIPNFAKSTAIGHKGNFIFGKLAGKYVCAMQGRFHFYEGYAMDQVTLPVRVMAALGIKTLFVSNAAGGLNQSFSVGDLMIIRDHINLMPNPLIGPNLDAFGERFPDMTAAYDLDLIARAEKIAKKAKIPVRKGVYLGNTGPSYETPAEVRYYISIGADAVGMSTVPEVLVARHCGIPVFGMSVITNVSNTDNASTVLNDGDDVVRAADAAADRMCAIFQKLIETI
ncbi:MAG: purine-nucleoside phosphorylase [Bacteroidales bacterium]|jgi:purine-nucleoside phosphorylase|nr:purine-nucleoside phosphorylase [Bacteroidales bacterium]MBR3450789.1 purine-nucleoside phosphorylase [Bacteroidales bacterium]